MVIFPGSCDRMIHIVCDKCPAKKVFHQCTVFLFCPDQSARNAQNPRLFHGIFVSCISFSSDGSQRKEGSPAIFATFQKFDHAFCGLFPVRHNVLDAAAKCRLDCRLIRRFYFDQIGYNAEDPRIFVFLLHHLPDTVSVSIIAFC